MDGGYSGPYDPASKVEDFIFPHPSEGRGSKVETLDDYPHLNVKYPPSPYTDAILAEIAQKMSDEIDEKIVQDSVAEVWFPPAGPRRGIVTGVDNVGYITGTLGTATTFVQATLNQGQRDVLYNYLNNINPIPFFPGRGIIVFGQKTSYSLVSALDRVNVMRMLMMIKRDIRKASFAFLFELNDRITQDSIKQMIDSYLHDILIRRGLYDFVTQCDGTNNTPTTIDRNELWVDIAVKPAKAIEFIYIPIRVLTTGATMP